MGPGLFVISRHGSTDWVRYEFYHSHGEFQGVKDAMSYSDMARARKFTTRKAAVDYIAAELPEHERNRHKVVEVDRLSILFLCPEEYAKILERESTRMITKLTFRLKPEDSMGVGIVEFYDRLATILGLDTSAVHYDCTKINVARNIQTNIFRVLGAQSTDPCYTGMKWTAYGPKTFDSLPDNTVELLAGFFTHNEEPLPFNMIINFDEVA